MLNRLAGDTNMQVPRNSNSAEMRASGGGSAKDEKINPTSGGFSAWSQTMVKAGLLSPAESSAQMAVPTPECGVSLEYLYKLSCRLGGLVPQDADTATVVQKMVIPCTNRVRRSRFFDVVPAAHTGPPQIYIVHAWSMGFKEMVDQLVHSLAPGLKSQPEVQSAEQPPPPPEPKLFVWLDVFALDQHPVLHTHADVMFVREVVRSCTEGVVVVVDKQLQALTRTWCQFEMWACLHYRDITKLRICLPSDACMDWLFQYETAVRQIDTAQSETSKTEDKTHLLSEIRSVVGMKRMQQVLHEALIAVARADLRWSKSFKDLATYCALLLKAGEYARLQQVLHHIPEIADDFKDIEVIYKMFAGKDNAQIDEASFTSILGRTGFDPEEARIIFKQVKQYDCDYIGLDEFNEWWNANRRKEVKIRNYSAPPVLTSEALTHNMQQMEALLERKGLPELAQEFRQSLNKVFLNSPIFNPGATLPSFNLHGDWENMANEVLSRLHCQDYRGAIAVLHMLIVWNRDCLDQNVHWLVPAETIQKISNQNALKLLEQYLELLTNLLQGRTTHASLSQCLRRFREKLQKNEVKIGGSGVRSRAMTLKDTERHAVVRSMIHLKYGGTPIDNTLIAEAELSLGKVLGCHKVPGRFDRHLENLNMMVLEYLRSSRAGELEKKREERQKPLRFRKLDYDKPNQSVLLSLGPEAVAFYQEQEEEAKAKAETEEAEEPHITSSAEATPTQAVSTPAAASLSSPIRRFFRSSSTAGTQLDTLFQPTIKTSVSIRAPRSSYAGAFTFDRHESMRHSASGAVDAARGAAPDLARPRPRKASYSGASLAERLDSAGGASASTAAARGMAPTPPSMPRQSSSPGQLILPRIANLS